MKAAQRLSTSSTDPAEAKRKRMSRRRKKAAAHQDAEHQGTSLPEQREELKRQV